jgi:hypothetical protein
MCVIIDSNCLAMVFDHDNKQHSRFVPVWNWVNGKGCMVYGGTKYMEELQKLPRYLAIVVELRKTRHAIPVQTKTVDRIAATLKREYPDPKFNDQHIVALVIASRCVVVCTDDKKAISYLKGGQISSRIGAWHAPVSISVVRVTANCVAITRS